MAKHSNPQKRQQIKALIADLGKQRVAEKVGVSVSAVDVAIHKGCLSARWFDGVEALCSAEGLDCDRTLFDFNQPADGVAAE